jgi:hypothetical protein
MSSGGGILTRMMQHKLLHSHIAPVMAATADLRKGTRSIMEFTADALPSALLSPMARSAYWMKNLIAIVSCACVASFSSHEILAGGHSPDGISDIPHFYFQSEKDEYSNILDSIARYYASPPTEKIRDLTDSIKTFTKYQLGQLKCRDKKFIYLIRSQPVLGGNVSEYIIRQGKHKATHLFLLSNVNSMDNCEIISLTELNKISDKRNNSNYSSDFEKLVSAIYLSTNYQLSKECFGASNELSYQICRLPENSLVQMCSWNEERVRLFVSGVLNIVRSGNNNKLRSDVNFFYRNLVKIWKMCGANFPLQKEDIDEMRAYNMRTLLEEEYLLKYQKLNSIVGQEDYILYRFGRRWSPFEEVINHFCYMNRSTSIYKSAIDSSCK